MSHPGNVPSYRQLLASVDSWNRIAWVIIGFQLFGSIGLIAIVDWPKVVNQPLFAIAAISVMALPVASSIILSRLEKKKRISDLRESTKFGLYDKHLLEKLYRETLMKLRLPQGSLHLYIVADRTLNASASHFGFGELFAWLNGIHVNRQVLHHLAPEEVRDIIGHELGHYYRYFLVTDRFRIVGLLFGATLGIFLSQWIAVVALLDYVIIFLVPALVFYINSIPYRYCAQSIEYLCDAMGAQVGGVIPSIQGLLKIGHFSEIESSVVYQAAASNLAGKFEADELIEAVQRSIPYGVTSRSEIEQLVEQELKKKAKAQGPSLGGLLRYMWSSDTDEEAKEELEKQAARFLKAQSIPRLDWESVLQSRDRVILDDNKMAILVKLIEEQPEKPLFRVLSEINPNDEDNPNTHPPIRSRILFLWFNRREIESSFLSEQSGPLRA
jgi:Zn-dependent protease with chaperone function